MKLPKFKIGIILIYLALFLIGIFTSIFLYWTYSPPKEVLTIRPYPIPVLTKEVKKDGSCAIIGSDRCVVLKVTRCKNVKADGRITTTLVSNNLQLALPTSSENSDRGCINDVTLPLSIPKIAVPGTYHFHFRVTYQINPIISTTQDFDTDTFDIVE